MEQRNIRYISLGIIVLCFIAFSPVFKAEFVGYDDPDYVLNNLNLRHFSWENITRIFSFGAFDLYIPVTFLSYLIEYSVFGANPKVFHVVNLILHILNSLLLFRLLLKLGVKDSTLILFILLFFSLSPLVCESVCWITERKDVLYCLFGILSALQFLEFYGQRKFRYLLSSFLFFLLACLSKPMAVTLPVLFMVYVLYKERRLRIKDHLFAIPFLALSLLISLLSIQLIKANAEMKLPDYVWYERGVLFLSELGYYFFKPFFPIRQQLIHLMPHEGELLSNSAIIVYALLAVVLLCGAIYVTFALGDRKLIGLFIAWFIFLLPILQVYPNTHSYVSERYFYVSIIFPVGVVYLLLRRSPVKEVIWKNALFVLGIVFLLLSINRSKTWQSTQTLFTHEVRMDPNNPIALNNLGYYYNSRNEFSTAKPFLQKAIRLDKDNKIYLNNYGWSLSGLQETDSAMIYFNKALSIDLDFVKALNNLGICYGQKMQTEKAFVCFEQAYAVDPLDAETNFNLGIYFISAGQQERGRAFMQTAHELGHPSAAKHLN